jgi:hypothetical protein
MPTDQDDADALFGSSPPPSPFAGKTAAGAGTGAENRKESRVRANWQARVLLPDKRVVQLTLHDLSESGVGLVGGIGIPAHSVLQIALAVPGLDDASRITPVTGTIKTTHLTVKGHDVHCGGMWVTIASDQRELVNQWVRRLRK